MVLKYSNLAFVFKKARIDYITDLVISTLFVIRLFATENIVLFHILKIYSKKKCTNGYLEESLRRIARHC